MAEGSIGGPVIKLSADGSQLTRGLDKARADLAKFDSAIASVHRTFSRIGSVALGALGIGGIGAGITQAVNAARESERAENKLAAVLRSTGGAAGYTTAQLKEYASQLQRTTDFEDDATVSAMAVLATFRNVQGQTFKQATALAQDMSSVMGNDLQSSVMQVGKALQDPIKGLQALTRIGVQFNEQQKANIKLFVESGQVAKAQGIILRELTSEVGGAAAAMADPITQMKNALGDTMEEIGKKLLPYIKTIANEMSGAFRNATNDLEKMRSGMDMPPKPEQFSGGFADYMTGAKKLLWEGPRRVLQPGAYGFKDSPLNVNSHWMSTFGGESLSEKAYRESVIQWQRRMGQTYKGGLNPTAGLAQVASDAEAKRKHDAEERMWDAAWNQREAEQKYLRDYIEDALEGAEKIRRAIEPLDDQFKRSIKPAFDLAGRGYLDAETAKQFAATEMSRMLKGLPDAATGDIFAQNLTPGSREAVRAIQGGMASPAERMVKIGEKQVSKLSDIEAKLQKQLDLLSEGLPKVGVEN